MIGHLHSVAFDVADVPRLREFYRELTGWAVSGDEEWTVLTLTDGRRVCLQQAPDHVPPRWPDPEHPQQLHLDLLTPDIEAAAERAQRLGATRLATVEVGGSAWVTLADPAGHPLDLCRRAESGDGLTDPMGLYAVTIDTEEPGLLGRFYAELLGLSLQYEGEPGVLIGGDRDAVMFQQVCRHVRPQWPNPEYPQQGHLDVEVEDVEEAQARVLALGATRLPGGAEDFRVFADPVGHPFCLVFDA